MNTVATSESSDTSSSSSHSSCTSDLEDVEESSEMDNSSSASNSNVEETLTESIINQESELETDTTVVEDVDNSQSECLIVSLPLALLHPKDLFVIQRRLWDVRNRWFFIGQALKISHSTLNVIELNHPRDTDHCFRV